MSITASTECNALECGPPEQVDHFSLLPDELLDPIFESAYSNHVPGAPLSKHLYPFFIEYLYRKVRLSSPRQIDLFLETISSHSERGKIVKSLEYARNVVKEGRIVKLVKSIDILESLLPLLPNLLHLEIEAVLIEVGRRSKNLFGSLSNITSVTTQPGVNEDESINLDCFAFLASLPSLSDLTVQEWYTKEWYTNQDIYFEEEEAFHLSHVKTLRIEGWGAEESSIKALVDLCPALLSVTLNTTYDVNSVSYGGALAVLPSTLRSLKLGSSYASIVPKDHLLRRFTQLRSLDLDQGCYSETIHIVLSKLPHLTKVRLGPGTISPLDFLPLVSGPTRLPYLEQLIFDLDVGVRGRRISQDALEEDLRGMSDWSLPEPPSTRNDDYEEVRGHYEPEYFADLERSVSRAGVNGVEIKGRIFEALANVEDYWIEASNRAVLSVFLYQEKTDRLRQVRIDAARSGVALPPLDIDSLDLRRLELDKIELPERDWFMYSVRNRGDSQEGSEMEEDSN